MFLELERQRVLLGEKFKSIGIETRAPNGALKLLPLASGYLLLKRFKIIEIKTEVLFSSPTITITMEITI